MSKPPASELKSSTGGVMIRVPAGSFTMGSPEAEDDRRAWERQREVTLGNDFYLGKTPVTQEQYVAVTGTNPACHEKIGDAPVDSVTWDQAKEFCQRLTGSTAEPGYSLTTGSTGYRLKRNGNTPAGREVRKPGTVSRSMWRGIGTTRTGSRH